MLRFSDESPAAVLWDPVQVVLKRTLKSQSAWVPNLATREVPNESEANHTLCKIVVIVILIINVTNIPLPLTTSWVHFLVM